MSESQPNELPQDIAHARREAIWAANRILEKQCPSAEQVIDFAGEIEAYLLNRGVPASPGCRIVAPIAIVPDFLFTESKETPMSADYAIPSTRKTTEHLTYLIPNITMRVMIDREEDEPELHLTNEELQTIVRHCRSDAILLSAESVRRILKEEG